MQIEHLDMALVLTAVIGGYLSGSVPYGLLVGQVFGVGDIRKTGSGNIGATNMLRAGGKKLAVITLLLDMLKGLIPVVVAKNYGMDYAVLTAAAALVGHIYPVWLKFKGGKGVATMLGVLFGLSFYLGALAAATWLFIAISFRYSSLSALVAVAMTPIYAFFMFNGATWWIATLTLMALLVIFKHRANIQRLIARTEPKIGKK